MNVITVDLDVVEPVELEELAAVIRDNRFALMERPHRDVHHRELHHR